MRDLLILMVHPKERTVMALTLAGFAAIGRRPNMRRYLQETLRVAVVSQVDAHAVLNAMFRQPVFGHALADVQPPWKWADQSSITLWHELPIGA